MISISEHDIEVEKGQAGRYKRYRAMFSETCSNRPIDDIVGCGFSEEAATLDLLRRASEICGQPFEIHHDDGGKTYVDRHGEY